MEKQDAFDHKIKRVIKAVERDKLIAELKTMETTLHSEKNVTPRFKYWMSAAAVILIAVFGIYFMTHKKSIDTNSLYSTHFTMYKNTIEPIIRNGNIETLSPRKKAFAYYELEKYTQALTSFETLIKTDTLHKSIIDFYRANIYLKQNNPKKALSLLLEITDSNAEWKDQILWYTGLAYLKMDNVNNAKKSFELLERSSYKEEEVSEILKALSKLSPKD